ncbi:MAG: polymer-forming cytoskeletal protein [Pseudomonadales bacterium]|nr:polymer-forming cytoskeletal protein [Pseudomonadales bacterium]
MKSPFNTSNITTLISKSTEISGDIHFSGTLEIEGKIKGNILAEDDSAAEVRIRESGVVQGEISVPSIIINGLVEGDVYSSNHVELAAKAMVVGNVYYNLIEMVMGSEVNGSLQHRAAGGKEPRRLSMEKAEKAKTDMGDESLILD